MNQPQPLSILSTFYKKYQMFSPLPPPSPTSPNKPLVFVITGQAHCGKDTFCRIATEELRRTGLKIEHGSFAGFLKILCKEWIMVFYGLDLPLSHFEDPVEKEREYSEHLFRGRPLKIRNVLQYMGTDVFRDQISATFWVEQLYKRQIAQSTADIFFITDCRFPNEIEYLKSMECCLFVLKITRSRDISEGSELSQENKQHKSEQLFDLIPYDAHLENSFETIQQYQKYIIEWIHSNMLNTVANNVNQFCNFLLHINYII